MSEPEPVTRVTLFVPGEPSGLEGWNTAFQKRGLKRIKIEGGLLKGKNLDVKVGVRWVANDGAFGDAFSFGTVEKETVKAIDAAPGALVLEWPIDLREGRGVIVRVVQRLCHAGALAVRIEESKVGYEVNRWLDLFSMEVDPWAWHRGAVAFVKSKTTLQSCGMHAFSLPDVLVNLEGEDANEVQELASLLNVYQIAEDPLLLSGQTFAPAPEAPRRVVERWPDTSFPQDHSCNNPYGVWRLGPAGGKVERALSDPVPVFMPPLRVVLAALEAQGEKRLSKREVEKMRDQGVCMMMSQREAQALERSRGYADIDPELAWEQWRLVREP